MNFKKVVATIASGALLFGVAGTALAENAFIYGASAQFAYWKAQAGPFLTTKIDVGSTYQTGCDGGGTGKNCVIADSAGKWIAVSNKASFDGICALQNEFETSPGNLATANPNCILPNGNAALTDSYGTTCGLGQRPAADPTSCGFTFDGTTNVKTCSKTKCTNVTAAASDVQAASISESTYGIAVGPMGCETINGAVTCQLARDFAGSPINDTGLVDSNPVVVPFAFYVNNTVKDSTGATVSNLSTPMVNLIFSGQITDWSEFGYPKMPISVCFRHAGSGTHATLDVTQMKPGYPLASFEDISTSYPTVDPTTGSGFPLPALLGYGYFFNDGTGDTMNCVNGSGVWHGGGAVAYADADILFANPGKYTNVTQVSLNGVSAGGTTAAGGTALATSIENNTYDYWTIENFYTKGSPDAFHQALLNFAADPANKIDPFYAQNCEMSWWKHNSDSQVPTHRGPVTCPNYER